MAARNPFRPSLGATPPLLVGRGDVIDDGPSSALLT